MVEHPLTLEMILLVAIRSENGHDDWHFTGGDIEASDRPFGN